MKYIFVILIICLFSSCQRNAPEETMVAIQIQDRNGLTETISSVERLDIFRDTDFLVSQPYKKVMRIYRNNGKSASKITTYHPNGTLFQYLEAEELRAFGAYREWYPNGQQKIEARVIGGPAEVTQGAQQDWLFDGLCQVWNDQGHLQASLPYSKGVLEGKSLYYYPNGKIEKELPYTSNVLDGIAYDYFPSGEIRSKTTYKQGALDGISTGYFLSRQIAWQEEYREDLILNGTYFNPRGELLSEVKDGNGFKTLFQGEHLSHFVQIQQGFAQGGVKQFNAKGDLQATYFIKNGKKIGTETTFFLPEECDTPLTAKLSVQWQDGSIHGTVKTWYNNGQLQSQRDFAHNKKTGPSLSWYRDGSLMLIEEYEEDKLVKGQYYKKNGLDSISAVNNGTGTATLFDEYGVFLRKTAYNKGEIVQND